MSKKTIFPSLTLRFLISAIFSKSEEQTLDKIWCGKNEQATWFSRSAWSLKAISQWWEKAFEQQTPNFWVPDYFCNQSLEILRNERVNLTFYSISANLTPDWERCQRLAVETPPDIFLMVHYFGQPTDGSQAKKFCNQFSSILVEDAAHVLMPSGGVGTFGDFVCYSPHKLLALPDGAILVQRPLSKSLRELIKGDSLEIMNKVCKVWTQTSPSSWKWLLKRLIQAMLPYVVLQRKFRSKKHDFLADDPATEIVDFPFQSKLSRFLLRRYLGSLPQYATRRKENLAIISSMTDHVKDNVLLLNEPRGIPYLAAFRFDSEVMASDAYLKITNNGNPVQSWPDLPPEVLKNFDQHEEAIHFRKTVLTFPVHQGLGVKDMDYLRRLYQNSLGISETADNFIFRPYTGGSKEWDRLLEKAGKSNLMQTWAYGEAKKKVEGWGLQRALICCQEMPVALVQILRKKVGPVSVVRINRGPILLVEMKLSTLRNVYQCLRDQFFVRKGNLLMIAPELVDSPIGNAVTKLTRYISRNSSKWSSSCLDLRLSENTLRKNLTSKWRNMVNVAEREGLLSVEFDESEEGFQWMMECYTKNMKAKGFHGATTQLIVALRLELEQKEHFLVCRAKNSEYETVAAVAFIRHGVSADYLIGWNGAEGRKLKANNFLLWNGIMEMKRRGCQWFDLGGIDEINTPDIARFKEGLNGKKYQLVGEFISI